MRLALVALLAVAPACGGGASRCANPPAATPLDPDRAGTIAGSVTLTGPPPPMKPIVMSDPQCAARHPQAVVTGDALVHDGKVENAFVYVKEGLGARTFAVPDAPLTIDQAGCLYAPHVAGARTCQPIEFLNSDALLHNVRGTPRRSSPWNFGLPVKGSERTLRVEQPEVMIELRCDVHPWMRGYLGVLDHPYFAVTRADGRFALPAVPAGDYVVAAWHERFGLQEARVTVPAGGTGEVAFTFN
jgi:hypothetical protein